MLLSRTVGKTLQERYLLGYAPLKSACVLQITDSSSITVGELEFLSGFYTCPLFAGSLVSETRGGHNEPVGRVFHLPIGYQ